MTDDGFDHWDSRPGHSANALRVLVVDDNADGADSLAAILRLWGHEVRAAHDGAAALRAAIAFRPDVALLDLMMPHMGGCEVARRLRGLPGLAGVVLFAMTGYGDEEHRRQCDGAGFAFYFVKTSGLGGLEATLGALARGNVKPTPV